MKNFWPRFLFAAAAALIDPGILTADIEAASEGSVCFEAYAPAHVLTEEDRKAVIVVDGGETAPLLGAMPRLIAENLSLDKWHEITVKQGDDVWFTKRFRFPRQTPRMSLRRGKGLWHLEPSSKDACLSATDTPRKGTAVFAYDDFGPQAAAYPLIGMQWYQWNTHGSGDPQEQDEIRVVVYRGVSLKEVQTQYPVIRDRHDYRYLEYGKAWEYLSKNETDPLLKHLAKTKKRLASELGVP
jgi:hypothetical protein